MITNKEIIQNQLKRINAKMKTNIELKRAKGYLYLCTTKGEYEMPPLPLSNISTQRTPLQMIEYLAGVEDAVDFYTHCGTV